MISIDVISGFLGAGKTTFIKNLLGKDVFDSEKVVILENEYGEVNMDAGFLGDTNIPVYEITKGCICCSLQDDFVTTLQEIEKAISPDRVIIEPSGIFMLETLSELLKSEQLRHSYQLDSVISIVDVTLFDGNFLRMEGLIGNQIKFADKVLLSKSNLGTDEMIQRTKSFIREYNSNAMITSWNLDCSRELLMNVFNKEVAVPELLATKSCGCHSHSCNHDHSHDHSGHHHNHSNHHHAVLQSETISINQSIDGNLLSEFVKTMKDGTFGDIIRMKGVLDVSGEAVECHYVNGVFDSEVVSCEPVRSFVVIGENINKKSMTSFLGVA